MSKLCLIYNFAPKYREGIFKLIDKEYDCDWYFGDNSTDIKGLDLSILKNVFVLKNRTVVCAPFYFQKGALSLLLNNKYKTYFMLGDLNCISTWLFILLKPIVRPSKSIYFWTHGWYGKEGFIKRLIKKLFFNLVNGVFLYGNYAKKLMVEEGFDANKLYVLHNSLMHDKQVELRKQLHITNIYTNHFQNLNKNIIFIGRLTAVKRLDMIINTIELLQKSNHFYNLTFVGDGAEKEKLMGLVNEKGLNGFVWFYGACYDDKINAQLIFNADLCVAPGNVGLTAIHSMVFGTPVITHDCFKYQMPEFEAVVKNKTGDFFQYGNIESLAQCIQDWFEGKKDQRDEVRKACYAEIDNYWTPEFQINVIKQNLIVE